MLASVKWLNRCLKGGSLTPDQVEARLMALGLSTESRQDAATCEGHDVALDVEVTSNRGDCLSHAGLARELAAHPESRGLSLCLPEAPEPARDSASASDLLTLRNLVEGVCPLFTAHVIRGVKVTESPAWLRALLEAIGQRPINNVVDVTNFITMELGNPCHVFDLAKLGGGGGGATLEVRYAREGEALTTLDGRPRKLKQDELVVADASRAQSLAGVMGGADSEVSEKTTDVVLEVATWDPVAVRRAARRHQLRTTASHRFERLVEAATLLPAAERGAALIAQICGGRVCKGVLSAGAPVPAPRTVRLRPARCRALLGYDISVDDMSRHLHAVEVDVGPLGRGGEELLCAIPAHRPDLTREVDLIEEVARINGLDAVPVQERLAVRVMPPQPREKARREVATLLTGLGFYETVTYSFTTPKEAAAFIPQGLEVIQIDDERRGGEPALRPSVLTGLLACRRQNQHAGVRIDGGLRLFEVAAVYAQGRRGKDEPTTVENLNLGLLLDVPGKGKSASTTEVQWGLRAMRGVVEALVRACAGERELAVEPVQPHAPAFDASAFASLALAGKPLGYLGLIDRRTQAAYDLPLPVVGAELNLPLLLAQYPPRSVVVVPPAFPGIERDVSLIVSENVRWRAIADLLARHAQPPMESVAFVGAYRGEQIGKGKKSVTVRLSFREKERTLRHDEVDQPVQALIGRLRGELAFDLRA